MKMLEKEVIRLRERETAALSKIDVLQRHIDVLVQTLKKSGISLPPIPNEGAPCQPLGEVGVVISDMKDPSVPLVQVNFPTGSTITPPSRSFARVWEQNEIMPSNAAISSTVPFSTTGSGPNPDDTTSFSLQDPGVGINFVLA